MLDKSQIGMPDKIPPLKCENCGLYYEFEEGEDWGSIDESGLCIDCYSGQCRHQSTYCDGFDKVE